MNLRTLLRPVAILTLGLATVFAATPAMAQSSSSSKKEVILQPPVPPTGKSDIPWAPYIMAILLLLMVVGVNFIPSKRGHQD